MVCLLLHFGAERGSEAGFCTCGISELHPFSRVPRDCACPFPTSLSLLFLFFNAGSPVAQASV